VLGARPPAPGALLRRCVAATAAGYPRREDPSRHFTAGTSLRSADFRGYLIGLVAWHRSVNPQRTARLERIFARIDWARV